MFLLAKYATATTFNFPMELRGLVDLAGQADWTPIPADTRVSLNGANSVQSTNLPVCGTAPEVHWQLTLTAGELSAATVIIQIVDGAPKAVEDQFILIYTYGNPLAKIAVDLSHSALDANVVQALGQTLILGGTGGQQIGT